MNDNEVALLARRDQRTSPREGAFRKDLKEIRVQTMQISRGKSFLGRGNSKCKASEARNISRRPMWLEKKEQEERRDEIRRPMGFSQKAR